MTLLDPIYNYCERTGAGLWNEPLNALSNLSFFIAAALLCKLYRASDNKCLEAALLIILVAAVGVGSTLFHTQANGLTMLADVIPISMFTFYYLWLAMRKPLALSTFQSLAGLLIFTIVASQMKYIPDPYRFNGSVSYFPSLAALLLIGGYLSAKHHAAGRYILKAAFLFALSLTFRSTDIMLCPSFPLGTHFLWHLLNGAVMYLLVKAIISPLRSTAIRVK